MSPAPALLLMHINSALASGQANGVSVEEVKDLIHSRNVFTFLRMGLTPIRRLDYLSRDQERMLNDEWIRFAERLDESVVFGVRRNGMCLLMAYLVEGIRRSDRGTNP
jgi:hypothetical protein